MNNRDLFTDFTNGVFNDRIKACVDRTMQLNGLFGYKRFRELENIFRGNFPAESYNAAMDMPTDVSTGQYDSSRALLNRYAAFINNPLTIERLAHIVSVVNRRTSSVDHSVLDRDIHPISIWDVASNDVVNAGKEARLLLLHKVVNRTSDDYMFQMISDEYLRAVINKFEYSDFSAEAVDIIGRIVGDTDDPGWVIMLLFATFAFTCVKTYGAPTTNSKLIAEVALQLCGTGVVEMDYYFRRIHNEFKDTDLTINYNLLSSIYSADLQMVTRLDNTVHNLPIPTGNISMFSSLLRGYLKSESSHEYDIDDLYYNTFTAWKEHRIIEKGDVRDSIKYIRALTKDSNKVSASLKTIMDSEHGVMANHMVVVLKSILDISPNLDSSFPLRRLSIYKSKEHLSVPENEANYKISPDTVGEMFTDYMGYSTFTDMPAWKHCLFILTYMRYGCGLPMNIRVEHLTNDIREMIEIYYNLYRGVEVGTPYKYMLSP